MPRLVVYVHTTYGPSQIDLNVELRDVSASWELVVHDIVQRLAAHTGQRKKDIQLTFRYLDDEGDLVTVSRNTNNWIPTGRCDAQCGTAYARRPLAHAYSSKVNSDREWREALKITGEEHMGSVVMHLEATTVSLTDTSARPHADSKMIVAFVSGKQGARCHNWRSYVRLQVWTSVLWVFDWSKCVCHSFKVCHLPAVLSHSRTGVVWASNDLCLVRQYPAQKYLRNCASSSCCSPVAG